MSQTVQQLKIVVLAIVMAFAVMLDCSRANAGSRETAIFAGGCFWCVESDFESVSGVTRAVSGFIGGTSANPTYRQVSNGGTGHLEAVAITFDTERVTYAQLVHLFFRSIDPTDAGGQFCDRGDSYRTAIFYTSDAQRRAAEAGKAEARRALGRRIVTPIRPASRFYPADESHQNYYRGGNRIITRWGVKRQSDAYEAYRQACGRDSRVKELWGDAAPFASHH